MTAPGRSGQGEAKIAIIGMSCLFPGAPDLPTFWSNIVAAVDSTRTVTDQEWDLSQYYDPDATSFGLSYSKTGGFITEFANFDPLKYGVMPNAVAGSDPDQLLTLRVAYEAMDDAGYLKRPFNRDRAEIILGRIGAPGAGCMNLIQQSKTVREFAQILDGLLPDADPQVLEAVAARLQEKLVPCNSDTIPGAMPNVLAGRIAARLGFRGRNLLIDAACASSMVAVETAVTDLLGRRCDFALAGGLHVNSSAVLFQMFCGLGALSRTDKIRPFDAFADGTLLGEGIGIICLKRYEDALADGDRIYATICGVASSSDGHGGSVLAPSMEGEALAMQNAYAMAGFSPSTVELLEAHGTGTPTGDVVELQAVAKVFDGDQSPLNQESPANRRPWCAVGSVKSMIGHCQSASAVAGIIKAALSLYDRVLPATINVSTANPKIDWAKHPCYVNTRSRPWIHAAHNAHPRRAAVSAFGFGGINGHLVLEEHCAAGATANDSLIHTWESELFSFRAGTAEELARSLDRLSVYINAHPDVVLKDLAYTLNCARAESSRQPAAAASGLQRSNWPERPSGPELASAPAYRLAVVASSAPELLRSLGYCRERLGEPSGLLVSEPERGIYFTAPGAAVGGKLAFVYPGLGSAYTNMLADLAIHFPEVREVFEIVDMVAMSAGASVPPSKVIFPPPLTDGLKDKDSSKSLASADFAVVAVLLAEYALYQLLQHLEIRPDAVMGCSTGEFAAITTGGAVDVLSVAQTFYALSTGVARSLESEKMSDLRSLRVLAPFTRVAPMIADLDVHLVADLGSAHITVTGSRAAVDALADSLRADRIAFHPLPAAVPYHTPLVGAIIDANHEAVRSVDVKPLAIPAWSCSTGGVHTDDVEAVRASFTELFGKPVKLRQTVEAMYEQGIRTFVEVGPNGVLTSLIDGILSGQQFIAVPANLAHRPALTQLHHLLAVLFTEAVPAKFDYLYQRRSPSLVDWRSSSTPTPRERGHLLPLAHASLAIVKDDLPSLAVSDLNGTGDQDTLPNASPTSLRDNRVHGARSRDVQAGADLGAASPEMVLESFLATQSTFYSQLTAVQEQIMTAYLAEDAGRSYPFLERANIFRHTDSTEIHLPVDLDTDLYLLDHAIGGFVSTSPAVRVNLMPVMVSLEIMAEAALAHIQSGVLVRMEQVKAFKRIVVESRPLTLKAVATGAANRVQVALYEDDQDGRLAQPGQPERPVMVADFIFESAYRQPPDAALSVSGSPPVKLTKRSDLYGPAAMFHGPRMQSVLALETIGKREIAGFADAGPAPDWMPGSPQSHFLVHPLLLDNASQFVLFYLYENDFSASALLPFFIDSIDLYGPADCLDQSVLVSARLPVLSERATEAAVEIVNSDGKVWASINGINSRRIVLTNRWAEMIADPLNTWLGTAVSTGEHLGAHAAMVQVDRALLPEDEATLDWCLDYLLGKGERAIWRDIAKTEKRRIDWLLGRIAAKEAVRKLIRASFGRILGPHDLQIFNEASRRPAVSIDGHPDLPPVTVSISHTDGFGLALAVLAEAGDPGVDAEIIRAREADFARTFLKPAELRYLDSCPALIKDKELTRIWSAKEALLKAFAGSVELSGLEAVNIAPTQELISVATAGGGGPFKIYCQARGDLVTAYTLRQVSD